MSKVPENRMGCFNLCHGHYVMSMTFRINFSQLETTVMVITRKVVHCMILDRKTLIREKLEKHTKPLKYMKKKVVMDVTLLRVENIEILSFLLFCSAVQLFSFLILS